MLAKSGVLVIFCGLLLSCGNAEKERADQAQQDSLLRVDSLASLVKPRKEIYNIAVNALKERLKAPSSAKFPAVALSNDTVKMLYNDSMAYIAFPYEAQNMMGVFLQGIAAVKLIRLKGSWIAADDLYAVNPENPRTYYTDFDAKAPGELKMTIHKGRFVAVEGMPKE